MGGSHQRGDVGAAECVMVRECTRLQSRALGPQLREERRRITHGGRSKNIPIAQP